MWRALEVNFGVAAACVPAVYPGYRALQRRISNYRSRHSSEESDTKREGAWLNLERTAQHTGASAGAVAPSALIDPDVPIPEAGILKMTELGFEPESMLQSSSSGKTAADESSAAEGGELESPRKAAQRADLANLERKQSQQSSTGSDKPPKTTTSWV